MYHIKKGKQCGLVSWHLLFPLGYKSPGDNVAPQRNGTAMPFVSLTFFACRINYMSLLLLVLYVEFFFLCVERTENVQGGMRNSNINSAFFSTISMNRRKMENMNKNLKNSEEIRIFYLFEQYLYVQTETGNLI